MLTLVGNIITYINCGMNKGLHRTWLQIKGVLTFTVGLGTTLIYAQVCVSILIWDMLFSKPAQHLQDFKCFTPCMKGFVQIWYCTCKSGSSISTFIILRHFIGQPTFPSELSAPPVLAVYCWCNPVTSTLILFLSLSLTYTQWPLSSVHAH